jgi:integrase
LVKFKKQLLFNDINSVFVENFKEYKRLEGVSDASISNYLRTFRALYNKYLVKNNVPDKMPFKRVFKDLIINKKSNNKYILKDGFKILENAKFDSKIKQRVVDLTLLQFYLGGLDFVDLYFLKKSQINDGRVWLNRKKLGDKGVLFDVKLTKKAFEIFVKYQSDDDYIFPFKKEINYYYGFLKRHNNSLKAVFKELNIKVLPVGGGFSTKNVRHSFATIAKYLMIEVDVIRELMGHTRNDVDTIYKDKYPQEIRDEALLKIINTN